MGVVSIAVPSSGFEEPAIHQPRRPSLRADESKSQKKFGKTQKSLDRLWQNVVEIRSEQQREGAMRMYRNRIQKAVQLSRTPFHIANQTPPTKQLARPIDLQRYRESQLARARYEVEDMTCENLEQLRVSTHNRIFVSPDVLPFEIPADDVSDVESEFDNEPIEQFGNGHRRLRDYVA